MYPPRQLLTYAIVSVFLGGVLIFNLPKSLRRTSVGSVLPSTDWEGNDADESLSHPDFSNYIALRKLSAEEFPTHSPDRRVIIVGDLHGMTKPFHKLLNHLDYKPSKDTLIHVGDIISRGSRKGSLAVLDYLSAHNITGVRGNHDQKVIEWRAWMDWISLNKEGKEWLESLERRWYAQQGSEDLDDENSKSWLETCNTSADKKWLRRVPEGWKLFSGHYKLARDMSAHAYKYLLQLPLRLYIPSAHTFIVHAGLLPSNPMYKMDDKQKQPLARIPAGAKGTIAGSHSIEELRNFQEMEILTKIPQNTDPWVTLNIRSIRGDSVSRTTKGKSWSKIWTRQMESCVGYRKSPHSSGISTTLSQTDDDDEDDDDDTTDNMTSASHNFQLPCYPSTTIYGHAAARGLDIKRWSVGLDSGCVYHNRLSALVIGGPENGQGISSYSDDDGDDDSTSERTHSIPFGDKGSASIVSVKC